jgi:hypothetical protein
MRCRHGRAIPSVLFFCLAAFAQPQAPDTLWTRTFGGHGWDYAESVVSTPDGGCAIAGYASDDTVASHAFILRVNGQGDSLWGRRYGPPESSARAICLATDEGFIFGGIAQDSSIADGCLSKVDEQGQQQWREVYDAGWNMLDIRAIRPTVDGGYIVGACGPGLSMSLLRTDSRGQEIWRCPFYAGTPFWVAGVGELADGSFLLAGTCDGPPPTYYATAFLAKASATGDSLWMRRYVSDTTTWCTGMTLTADGGGLLCCHRDLGRPRAEIYLLRVDGEGNPLWMRALDDGGNSGANDAVELADGNFIVAGLTSSYGAQQSDYFLLKLSATGDSLWMRLYGTSGVEQAPRLAGSAETGFILAGWTLVPGRRWDIYVVKTAPLLPVDPPPAEIVHRFRLYPAYPNPFNGGTTISFELDHDSDVVLAVFDVLGKEVATLWSGRQAAGRHWVVWNAESLPSGSYFCRLSGDRTSQTSRLLLLK